MNNIKQLNANDPALAQEVFILFRRVFDEVEIRSSDLPEASYIKSLLDKNSFHVFAAISDNKVVGGLTAYDLEMYLKKEKEMYLYDLAVDENYRRQGIARALIEKLKDHAKHNNVSTIFVEAHREDVEAIEFYKSLDADMEDVCHFNISIER